MEIERPWLAVGFLIADSVESRCCSTDGPEGIATRKRPLGTCRCDVVGSEQAAIGSGGFAKRQFEEKEAKTGVARGGLPLWERVVIGNGQPSKIPTSRYPPLLPLSLLSSSTLSSISLPFLPDTTASDAAAS